MTRIAATELRSNFAEACNRVAYGGERILLERHGKDVAALVSVRDVELLQQLEDRIDLEAAHAALKEPGSVSWDDLKARLGL
jgi:antitoxin Phd